MCAGQLVRSNIPASTTAALRSILMTSNLFACVQKNEGSSPETIQDNTCYVISQGPYNVMACIRSKSIIV